MEKYTFETFVKGKSNELAYEVSKALSENPEKLYSPLFIYSRPGLGKTHLLKAIQYYIKKNNPKKKVIYVTASDWVNELIECVKKSSTYEMKEFKEKYRRVDMLLIDDIQFVAAKQYSQQMLIYTLKELELKQKSVVLSSDLPPKDLIEVDGCLKSMFVGGLIAKIERPDYQTRLSILHNLQNQYSDMKFEEEGIKFIAENIYSDVRALEGALQSLYVWLKINASVQQGKLDYKKIVKDYL